MGGIAILNVMMPSLSPAHPSISGRGPSWNVYDIGLSNWLRSGHYDKPSPFTYLVYHGIAVEEVYFGINAASICGGVQELEKYTKMFAARWPAGNDLRVVADAEYRSGPYRGAWRGVLLTVQPPYS